MPWRNVSVASRPDFGWVLTWPCTSEEMYASPALGSFAAVALGRVRRQQVPLRRARAERVRGDDLDARLEEVVPVLDALGVALADDDGHDRPERDPLVLAGVPALVDQPCVDQTRDVGLDGEVDDVGGCAGLDLARLVARGAVGLLEGDSLAGRGRVERRDQLVEAHLGHGIRIEVDRAGARVAARLAAPWLRASGSDVARATTGAGGQRDCRCRQHAGKDVASRAVHVDSSYPSARGVSP